MQNLQGFSRHRPQGVEKLGHDEDEEKPVDECQQVVNLVNLASNAVKFTEHGEVLLRAIPLDQGEGGLLLRFEVVDTGIGIDPADQHQASDEALFRAKAAGRKRAGGSRADPGWQAWVIPAAG